MEAFVKDLSLLINSIGAGLCFLLACVYFGRISEGRKTEKGMLSFLFFIIGFIILNTILNFTGYSQLITGFEPVSNAFCYALAPLLYLSLRSNRKGLKRHWLLSVHLYLFYAYLLFSILVLASPFTGLFKPGFRLMQSDGIIIFWNLQFAAYAIAGYSQLKKGRTFISKTMPLIYWGIVSIWIINTLFFLYRMAFAELPELLYLNITLLFTFLMVKVAYTELSRKMIYGSGSPQRHFNPLINKVDKVLLEKIEIHKYYRDPGLDIRKLSEHLNIPYPKLSRLINSKYQKNFNEFINSYRIEEVVKGLMSDHHNSYTIMGLAQEAGFKSGSAFYSAFKKEKGMTPRAYLRTLRSA